MVRARHSRYGDVPPAPRPQRVLFPADAEAQDVIQIVIV